MSDRRSFGRVAASVLLLSAILWFASTWQRPTLYFNGIVHTIDSSDSTASAVVTRSDRISFVGSDPDAEAFVKNRYPLLLRLTLRRVYLHGQSLLPGFVDAHSHFLATGLTAVLPDLSPPASGGSINSTDALYRFVSEEAGRTAAGDWIVGFNYDNTAFHSGRHPTRESLDAVTSEHPVFVRHNSGHMGVANSLALERMAADTDLPESVRVEARERLASFTPASDSGLLQELAAPPLGWLVIKTPWRRLVGVVSEAIDNYASQGYTTVQSGSANSATVRLLAWLTRLGWVPQRVIVWPLHEQDEAGNAVLAEPSVKIPDVPFWTLLFGNQHFVTGPTKLIVDGSPQGYTAYLSTPYHLPQPGASTEQRAQHQDRYRGHSLFTMESLHRTMAQYLASDRAMAIHTNGDGAIEQVLNVLEAIGNHRAESRRRVVLVHAQTIRQDQIDRLAALGVTPSYFPGHTWHWGEWHYHQSLGPQRAPFISPANSTLNAGVRLSIHTDAPVTPTDSMQLLWMATRRQTQQGRILGEHERLTRLQALRAMTIDPAWQNGVDDDRGTVEVGKFADFVVLSATPLNIDDVRTIAVVRTVVGSQTIYQRDP